MRRPAAVLLGMALSVGAAVIGGAAVAPSASSQPCPTPTAEPGLTTTEAAGVKVRQGDSSKGRPGRRVEVTRGDEYLTADVRAPVGGKGSVEAWAGANEAGQSPTAHLLVGPGFDSCVSDD